MCFQIDREGTASLVYLSTNNTYEEDYSLPISLDQVFEVGKIYMTTLLMIVLNETPVLSFLDRQ